MKWPLIRLDLNSSWPLSRKSSVFNALRPILQTRHRMNSVIFGPSGHYYRPERSVQEVVIDLLQPVFRKDEESAWTIVQSRTSTKFRTTSRRTSVFSRANSVISRNDVGLEGNQRFAFENELITGPVYKRVLFAHLCNMPTVPEAVHPTREQTGMANSRAVSAIDAHVQPNQRQSLVVNDWSPENISRVLKKSAGFSISIFEDCEELAHAIDRSAVPKRSLPLGTILKRHGMLPEKQRFVNAKLILAAAEQDLNLMAEALEQGADINTLSDEGKTPLQICLDDSSESLTTDLLFLYRETNVQHRNIAGDTLFHQAVKTGDAARFYRLITFVDDLRVVDASGATPLHTAAVHGVSGLAILERLNEIYEGDDFHADTCLDRTGRSPLHWAVQAGNEAHAVQLLRLGCDPSFHPNAGRRNANSQFQGSPLYRAVAAGNCSIVEQIFSYCSRLSRPRVYVNLANWNHHPMQSLLECAMESLLPQKHDMMELLVANDADFSRLWRYGDYALKYAVNAKHARLFLRLLSRGCRPSYIRLDITPLLSSVRGGTRYV